jgi:hypothetical protein
MLSPRSGLSLIVWNNTLYAIGGYDGVQRLQSMESLRSSIVLNWQDELPMIVGRSNFATTTLNGRMLAIGGYNGLNTIDDVEAFNGVYWKRLTPMNMSRSALKVCTLNDCPLSSKYCRR